METRIAYSDTRPRAVRIGPTHILVATDIVVEKVYTDDGGYDRYAYTEHMLTPSEYLAVQDHYEGDVPALRIIHLKFLLSETDYVVTKIAEAEDQTELRKEYASILDDRRRWREEIQSLGG